MVIEFSAAPRLCLLYSGLCLWIGSFLAAQTDVSNFRVPSENEQGVLESVLMGEKARMYPDKPMWIEGLVIEFYQPDGKTVNIRLTSPGCHYDPQTNFAESEKKVKIVGKDYTIEGTGYRFDSNSSRMELQNDVRVVFKNTDFTSPRSSGETVESDSESEPSQETPSVAPASSQVTPSTESP